MTLVEGVMVAWVTVDLVLPLEMVAVPEIKVALVGLRRAWLGKSNQCFWVKNLKVWLEAS